MQIPAWVLFTFLPFFARCCSLARARSLALPRSLMKAKWSSPSLCRVRILRVRSRAKPVLRGLSVPGQKQAGRS